MAIKGMYYIAENNSAIFRQFGGEKIDEWPNRY